MPRGAAVIGVGGSGRGALNYVKRGLEQEYGSPEAAGVVLYCIDGPESDQYILPGGYQIDTSPQSREFYHLRENPVNAIQAIATRQPFAYVDRWLTPEDAQRVPTAGIDPTAGFGGQRIPGRVNLFLEIARLQPALQNVINTARGLVPAGERVRIFLVGSQSGGTGAGLLLDVAHLLHALKGNDWLIGLVMLPNSFNAVFGSPDDLQKRDAKALAGLRELLRFMDASVVSPTSIHYAERVNVATSQLFDLCFLVDGMGESFPVYGVVPPASDLLLTLLRDTQHIAPNVINWMQQSIAPAPSVQKWSTFGIHSFIYPDRDLIQTFALRFAEDLYRTILTGPAEAADEGKQHAITVLRRTKFGEMAVDLQLGRGLPILPLEFAVLRQKITTGIGDPPFPEDPILNLEEVVKTTGRIMRRVSNATVMDDCQRETGRYLGQATDTAPQTVNGWINYQSEQIARRFADDLARQVRDIFYELRQNQLRPRSLAPKPYTIMTVSEFLDTTRTTLQRLRESLEEAYRAHTVQVVAGQQTDIFAEQRKHVDDRAQDLIPMDGHDRDAQEEYISEYQRLLVLEVWDRLMKGSIALTARLQELADALWTMVGDPAEGWVSYFHTVCQPRLTSRLTQLMTRRTQFASIKARRYFPAPNDRAEQALYRQYVLDGGLLDALLRDMSWTFESAQPDQLGFAPKQAVESYELVLHLPAVPGFDRDQYERSLADVATGRVRRLILSHHTPDEIVQFATARLSSALSALGIWDALHYDYTEMWAPAVQQNRGTPTVEQYVETLVTELTTGAAPLLSQQMAGGAAGATAASRAAYCLAAFQQVPNAQLNSVEHLATAFAERMGGLNLAHSDAAFSKAIVRVNCDHGVPLHNWAYYPRATGHYFQYLMDPGHVPIHLFPTEHCAAVVEGFLAENTLFQDPIATFTPPGKGPLRVRCLDISVVRYLADLEAFRHFTYVYAFGLLQSAQGGTIGTVARYYIEIPDQLLGQRRVDLGPVWDLAGLLHAIMGEEEIKQRVRAALQTQWHQHEEDLKKAPGWQETLRTQLRDRADQLAFPAVPAGQLDRINRDDLKLAMKAMLYMLVGKLATP